jgi:uncharacterized membrane protein HdeD (DUF308 family)
MASDGQQNPETSATVRGTFDLSLRVVILFILGVFMLIFGLLLFRIHTGDLPYNPDSLYGLILVIVSLQVITIGKTPFGDLRRSWMVVIIGICTAVLGMSACFIPGLLTGLIRALVGMLLFAGGIIRILQLLTAEEKAKKWMRIPGILRQLTVACALMYLMTVVIGLVSLFPGITTGLQTAVLLIIYGISFIYLAWCIGKVTRLYPPEETKIPYESKAISAVSPQKGFFKLFREASLSLPVAILILFGVLLTLLGLLLFPVNLGMLPYSLDGQLGLLLFIMAVQMLTTGYTPIGEYKRSWLLMIIGVVFAAMGIVACIVPGLLTGLILILLGLLNLSGGAIPLIKRFIPMLHDIRHPPAEPVTVTPATKKLLITLTAFNIVTIIFGITVFVPGLIAGLALAGFLVIYGLLLFELAYLLRQVT